ncbi:Glycerol kinase [Pigmentiphaga humi]|uniref:Glycerol kinase n=1 Tax=Pigmentiphaga humi TaxID=2478468 RepID=A0A3P4B1F5_9BURK|nr:glycerol kinase GlpK [Pigmentiphaga humi]VCU69478.1 Glycerol kinase [Pigmentiphaga humi]
MRYILALDQGTTSSRALLVDHAGQIVAVAQKEFTQRFPRPGWVEHDPMEIWQSQLAVARACLERVPAALAGQGPGRAASVAIGITNQRETTVLWDRLTGEPVGSAIVWQDRRTAAQCDRLRAAGKEDLVRARTGLLIDAYFSATKLQWLLDNVPGARLRARNGELAFGTVDAWLIWNLTGGRVHATDASNASRTLLFDIRKLDWDDELLALFDIPRSVLPAVVPSCGVLGETDPGLFGSAIPIAGIAGDQQAATFGQACFAPGMVKNTYGTGCFMLMNTGTAPVESANQLVATVGWQGPPGGDPARRAAYCLEASVFMAGATIQWLRDGLKIISSAPEVEALAASVADPGDVYLVPAFAGLGAPDWDPYARGVLIGLTRGTTRAHIARAALESIALQVTDSLAAMMDDSSLAIRELRVDGGACGNDLLMQMQADFLGVPVARPQITETTALGAAYLAGLATGFWADGEEIAGHWQLERRFEPSMTESARRAKVARWREAVARSRAWARP